MFSILIKPTANYPFEHLPGSILDAINSVQQITKAPGPLIAASALGAASTACQGMVDVQRPTVPTPCPVALFLLTVAESGERKSAVDSFFFSPIDELDQSKRKQLHESTQAYQAQLDIWDSKVKGLKTRIHKAHLKGCASEEMELELCALHQQKPQKPLRMRIGLSDVTPEALVAELAQNPCTATLHSNEAAGLIRGRTMGNLPLFNRLWDGQRIEVDRTDATRSLYVEGARLTTILAVQPDSFEVLCKAKDGHARNSGFLARTLLAHPASTAGHREVDRFDGGASLPDGVRRFQTIVQKLLIQSLERHAQGHPRSVMHFNTQAADLWIRYFNEVEANLNPNGGRFHLIKDFAAKAAENVARMAAIFEYFAGGSIEISEDSVRRAIKVVTWYLFEFDRLFGATNIENATQKNAEALLQWLRTKSAFNVMGKQTTFSRRQIMQFGPKATRSADCLEPAIECLISSGSVSWSDFFGKSIIVNTHQSHWQNTSIPLGENLFSTDSGIVHQDLLGVISR